MRWRTPVVLTLALFVAASCDQAPTAVQEVTLDGPTLQVVQNEWVEYPWEFEHCDEWIDAWLRTKILYSVTESASGNTNWQLKYVVKGTGVGRDTGYEYVWNNSFGDHETVGADGYPYTYNYIDNWIIIGKGKAPDFKEKVTYKITMNAIGDVTAEVLNVHSSCD
jgi:hypothetical protein